MDSVGKPPEGPSSDSRNSGMIHLAVLVFTRPYQLLRKFQVLGSVPSQACGRLSLLPPVHNITQSSQSLFKGLNLGLWSGRWPTGNRNVHTPGCSALCPFSDLLSMWRNSFLFLYFTFSISFFVYPRHPTERPSAFLQPQSYHVWGKSSSASEHAVVRTVSALEIQPL